MSELYIGLMSGTSLDGIDAGLVEFDGDKIKLLSFDYTPFSADIKNLIHCISQTDTAVLLKDYGAIDTQLGCLFAQACKKLLKKANISSTEIKAIGSHGQTIYHAPEKPSAFSLQIGDPNIIAEETGITTIADFRREILLLVAKAHLWFLHFIKRFLDKHSIYQNKILLLSILAA